MRANKASNLNTFVTKVIKNNMKTDYQQLIILKIKRIREQNNYSQQKLATLLGISNGQMGNIESPQRTHKYTLSQIYTICHKFNIRIEQIFLEDSDYSSGNIIDKIITKIIEYGE